ncbi:MAG: hypothetical protein BJ554DRAFT_5457, partial [Olpidium bornovanus]
MFRAGAGRPRGTIGPWPRLLTRLWRGAPAPFLAELAGTVVSERERRKRAAAPARAPGRETMRGLERKGAGAGLVGLGGKDSVASHRVGGLLVKTLSVVRSLLSVRNPQWGTAWAVRAMATSALLTRRLNLQSLTLLGNESWKNDPSSPHYDYKLIVYRLRYIRSGQADLPSQVSFIRSGGCTDVRLFKRCYIGTKKLVEEYNENMVKLLWDLAKRDFDDGLMTNKRKFFEDTRRGFGRSALVLQGGATFGVTPRSVPGTRNLNPSLLSSDDEHYRRPVAFRRLQISVRKRPAPDDHVRLRDRGFDSRACLHPHRQRAPREQKGNCAFRFPVIASLTSSASLLVGLPGGNAKTVFSHGGIDISAFENKSSSGNLRRKLTRLLRQVVSRTQDICWTLKSLKTASARILVTRHLRLASRFPRAGLPPARPFCPSYSVPIWAIDHPRLSSQEAHHRTGRILNITVSPARKHEVPQLLNYLTAPNVVRAYGDGFQCQFGDRVPRQSGH